jgi:mannosyltransferase
MCSKQASTNFKAGNSDSSLTAPHLDNFDKTAMASLFLLAIALRYYGFNSEGFWGDEIITLRVIDLPFGDIFRERLARGHFPLYFFLLKFWSAIGGDGRLWLLAPNMLAGSLAASVYYLVARTIGALRSGALLAGLLAACAPLQIMHAQELRMYPLALLLGSLSLLIFLRSAKRSPGFIISLIVFGAFAATHATAIILLSAMLATAAVDIFFKKRNTSFQTTAALMVVTTLQGSILLYAMQFVSIRDRINLGSINIAEPIYSLLFLMSPGYPNPAPGTVPVFVGAGLLILALMIRSLTKSSSNQKRTFKYIIATFVIFTLIMLLKFNLLSSSRYLLYAQVMLFGLAGLGLTKIKNRSLRLLPIILLTLASLFVAWQRIEHIGKPQWREAAASITEQYTKGERIWFFSLADDNPFGYYMSDRIVFDQDRAINLLLGSGNKYALDRNIKRLTDSLENAEGIWLVRDEQLMTMADTHTSAIRSTAPDTPVESTNVLSGVDRIEQRLRFSLAQHYPVATTKTFQSVTIFHYSQAVTAP